MDDGITNAAWDTYDSRIQAEVTGYNVRFLPTVSQTDYRLVDWKLCKAIVWVESGGPSSTAWTARVMQIGNPGDPAINVLRRGAEGSSLIMSRHLAIEVKSGNIDNPVLNIRAGIAYLFTRLAVTDIQSVLNATDPRTYSYAVVAGDTLERIAEKVGTTVAALTSLNPSKAKIIRPKDVLTYRKASMQRVIVGWREFTTANVARYYNVGDPDYAAKLDYVLSLFTKLKRPPQPVILPQARPIKTDPASTRP